MSDKQNKNFMDEAFLAEILLRVSALENLLVAKGVFSKEELKKATDDAAYNITKSILIKANVQGDLDYIINNLQGKNQSGN